MKPGDVRTFEGRTAIVVALGTWAEKRGNWIHIHLTGDKLNFRHVTVVNDPESKSRYNRVLFRELRNLLIAYDKWPFGNEGAETENE